jgi:hypothetical protein
MFARKPVTAHTHTQTHTRTLKASRTLLRRPASHTCNTRTASTHSAPRRLRRTQHFPPGTAPLCNEGCLATTHVRVQQMPWQQHVESTSSQAPRNHCAAGLTRMAFGCGRQSSQRSSVLHRQQTQTQVGTSRLATSPACNTPSAGAPRGDGTSQVNPPPSVQQQGAGEHEWISLCLLTTTAQLPTGACSKETHMQYTNGCAHTHSKQKRVTRTDV